MKRKMAEEDRFLEEEQQKHSPLPLAKNQEAEEQTLQQNGGVVGMGVWVSGDRGKTSGKGEERDTPPLQ